MRIREEREPVRARVEVTESHREPERDRKRSSKSQREQVRAKKVKIPKHCFVAKQLNENLFCCDASKYGIFCQKWLKYAL